MQDKSNYSNPNKPQISEGLQDFINAMVEEIVLKGEAFDDQKKKWLKKYSEAEGLNYQELEGHLSDFFELVSDFHKSKLSSLKKSIVILSKNCFIEDSTLDVILHAELLNKLNLGEIIFGDNISDDLQRCLLKFPKYIKKENSIEKKERLEFLAKRKELLFRYDGVDPLRYGLAKVRKGNNIGFVNKNGDLVIPLEFDLGTSYDFTGNFCIVGKREGGFFSKRKKDLIIDNTGNITHSFSRLGSYQNTWLDESLDKYVQIVCYYGYDKAKYGLIDMYGKTLFETNYDRIKFAEGLFIYKQGHYSGIMDSEKNELLPTNQFVTIEYNDGVVEFQERNDKYCEFIVFDRKNNKVTKIDKHFDSRGPFNDGLSVVSVNNKYGAINTEGVEVIPIIYDRLGHFYEEFAVFEKNGKCGYLDNHGNEVVPPVYDDAILFTSGLASVKKGKKWGFINTKGNLVIPHKFTLPLGFEDGVGSVLIRNGVYFIDESGNILKKRKD